MNKDLSRLPTKLLQAEVEAICYRYRINPTDARAILEQHFAGQPKLLQKIAERYPAEDVTRLSDYRRVIKAVKKQVYYYLRQYHQELSKETDLKQRLQELNPISADSARLDDLIADLLSTHVSTQERFPYYETFYQVLFDLLDPPRTILDLGCGLHPLSFPFQQTVHALQLYIAIDKDAGAIETLAMYAPHVEPVHLEPVCADLATARWADYVDEQVDLTLMLKLIPVLQRYDKSVLPHLASVPTRLMLVTASAEAMTRRQSIRRREARVLRQFVALTGREVVANFEVGNEFGHLLR